ncbi:MAG: ATP-dependent 6-phosphofructokinase [Candidatus Eiseniibacteriota bacterium]|jgi:6-phosphofructokinase 1
MPTPSTIGILTGGGDCPGLNAVIRAVTKTAITRYDMQVVGFLDGFAGVVENRYQRLDYHHASGILTRGGTILGTSNRANPFSFEMDGEMRDMSALARHNLKHLGIDVLFVVGGDGTLSIADRMHRELGVRVIGVPKTIDNDLSGTERTFGFDSAVSIATEAIDRLHTTAQSHHRVMVVEVMGRYAGWIALHSGVAGGSDVILIPEIPYRNDVVAEFCLDRRRCGVTFTIITIAEGAKEEGGELTVKKIVEGSHDPLRLGGVGYRLAAALEQHLAEAEVRVTVLGHLQRGGIPTAFDRVLATRFGATAVDLAAAGQTDIMVGLQADRIVPVPISEAVAELKLVGRGDPLVRAARSVKTSFGDVPVESGPSPRPDAAQSPTR